LRYDRPFRIFASFLRTFSEMLTNAIGPAIAARFFIYLFGWPNTLDVFGWKIPTFALVIGLTLVSALVVIWSGGMISLVVTDALQAILSYPIFLILSAFILIRFSWFDQVMPALSNRVPGESFLNPFDVKELRDFNLFAVFVAVFASILNRGVWCGGGTDTAAKTAHESKMAGVLGSWRNGFAYIMLFLLSAVIFTVMNHRDFVQPAREVRLNLTERIMENKEYVPELRAKVRHAVSAIPVETVIPKQSNKKNQDTPYFNAVQKILRAEKGAQKGNAAALEFQTLFNQMRLPVALQQILPGPLLAMICLLALLLMLSTDDSKIFSSARTLAQDVILPFRKKPLTTRQHLWLIRWLTLFVCATFFIGSIFLSQLDFINLYITIMTSIWVGGAGAVTLFGLYTRFGTTAGAYAALFTGAFLSGGGVLIQRNWPDHVYPFLKSMGWVEGLDRFLRTAAAPFVPYIRWEMNPVKFPVNSTEISFISMTCSVLAYCLVSLLTCRKPYDLDKLLHRGKYNIENKNEEELKWSWKTFVAKIIGITPEYSKGDRIIAWSVFIYSFGYGFLLCFIGTLIWNWISPWPEHWWGIRYFITTLVIGCLVGSVSTVWFMWGGIRDIILLFHDLAVRKANPEDNGMVINEEE
ncbi:MAG: sodium:panthothenate symporter, partial [Lentisphaeria bacterium]|nr:sodium:panthothenate symporter [Lentisphaeria bacterium]